MSNKVQAPSKAYDALKQVVDSMLKCSYRHIEYTGMENLPKDGAIILAPNHTNGLMDALVLLAMDKQPKVYVARADIFRNKKTAKILHFLRIMPIMRARDGLNEVRKNNVTIDASVDVLKDSVPFCILPEGTHRAQHSLLPLGKGIFRIALQAMEQTDVPIRIVPIGIEYSSYFRYRHDAYVTIGKPMDIREIVNANPDLDEPQLMNLMKQKLTTRMKELIFYIPDDEWYEATTYLCAAKQSYHGSDQKTRMDENNRIAQEVVELRKKADAGEKNGIYEELKKCAKSMEIVKKNGVSLASVAHPGRFGRHLLLTILALFFIPYLASAALLFSPIYLITAILAKKLDDPAFRNSVQFTVKLILWPIIFLIYAVVAFITMPWFSALVSLLLIAPAYMILHDVVRLVRLLISDIRLRMIAKNLSVNPLNKK